MKLTDYVNTWEGSLRENRHSRWLLLLAVVIILVQALALANKDTTVVLVPPQLEERGQVSGSAASTSVYVSWGTYIATLLGNVTPQTVEMMAGNVGQHLSPAMYRSVLDQLNEQAKTLKEEQLSVSFVPTITRWEESVEAVVVTGDMITRGVRGGEQRVTRTYEMRFIVQNYRVLLDHLRTFDGGWRGSDTPKEQ